MQYGCLSEREREDKGNYWLWIVQVPREHNKATGRFFLPAHVSGMSNFFPVRRVSTGDISPAGWNRKIALVFSGRAALFGHLQRSNFNCKQLDCVFRRSSAPVRIPGTVACPIWYVRAVPALSDNVLNWISIDFDVFINFSRSRAYNASIPCCTSLRFCTCFQLLRKITALMQFSALEPGEQSAKRHRFIELWPFGVVFCFCL